ncbi:MAG: choice-of-anchor J domain-containing protein, partial [Bacteroidota bacterium]
MKKVTLFIVMVLIAAVAWSQFNRPAFQSKYEERSQKAALYDVKVTHHDIQQNAVKANVLLEEDFDSGTFPPTGWTKIDGPNTEHWQGCAGDQYILNGTNIAYCYWEAATNDQDEWLITPTIAVPSAGQPSRLVFEWCSTHYWMVDPYDNGDWTVFVSTDGGTTFPDTIWCEQRQDLVEAAGGVWPWDTYVWYTAYCDLSAYAGQSINIAWNYRANDAGSVGFDNVMVFEVPQYDATYVSYRPEFLWFDYGTYRKIPCIFPQDMFFWAKPQNVGTDDLTNVTLTVDINDGTGSVFNENVVATAALTAMQWDSLTIDTTTWFTVNDPIPTSVADLRNYTVTFTIDMDQTDDFPGDNVETFTFCNNDTVFARDNGNVQFANVGPGNWVDGGVDGDIFGVRYDLTADAEVNSVSFHVSQYSDAGSTIKAVLYMSDGSGGFVAIIESDVYDVQAGDLGQWVTLPFMKDGFSEFTTAGIYIAGIQVLAFNGGDFAVSEDNQSPQASYATFWNLVNLGQWYYFGNYSNTPFIRLNFPENNCTAVNVNNSNNAENIRIFPNPANDLINLTNAENANVTVYDA